LIQYSYEIASRPVELGGGWRLSLLEDGVEVGGGVFPVEQADPHQGMAWWNTMTEDERGLWLKEADSARPVDAYQAFLLADAYINAENEAYAWLDTRGR
jgi:hypothetical protein